MLKKIFLSAALLCVSSAVQANTAKVISLVPGVDIIQEGKTSVLAMKMDVPIKSSVRSDATGKAQFMFPDGATVSVAPDTEIALSEFVDTPDQENIVLNLAEGTARIITGEVSKRNPAAFTVNTPQASIGIRGTIVSIAVRDDQTKVYLTETSGLGVSVTDKNSGKTMNLKTPGNVINVSPQGIEQRKPSRSEAVAMNTGAKTGTAAQKSPAPAANAGSGKGSPAVQAKAAASSSGDSVSVPSAAPDMKGHDLGDTGEKIMASSEISEKLAQIQVQVQAASKGNTPDAAKTAAVSPADAAKAAAVSPVDAAKAAAVSPVVSNPVDKAADKIYDKLVADVQKPVLIPSVPPVHENPNQDYKPDLTYKGNLDFASIGAGSMYNISYTAYNKIMDGDARYSVAFKHDSSYIKLLDAANAKFDINMEGTFFYDIVDGQNSAKLASSRDFKLESDFVLGKDNKFDVSGKSNWTDGGLGDRTLINASSLKPPMDTAKGTFSDARNVRIDYNVPGGLNSNDNDSMKYVNLKHK